MSILSFKALSWGFHDHNFECFIHVSGISSDDQDHSKSIKLKIKNYRPFCYVELPASPKWSDTRKRRLLGHIKRHCRQIDPEIDYETMKFNIFSYPKQYEYVKKYDIYGRIPKEYLYLEFGSKQEVNNFSRWMVRKQSIDNFYNNSIRHNFDAKTFLVHEHNTDPIIHLAYDRNIKLAGWIEAKDAELIEEDELGFYYECDYQDISSSSNDKMIFPKYISFDLECYSENHNSKLPDPNIPENVIFHIGVIIGRLEDNVDNRRYILLTLGKTLPCTEIQGLTKDGLS